MKKTPITGKAEDSYSLQLSSSVVLHPETGVRISVYGVLPGEEVRFRHGTVKGEHVGYLDEVMRASPHRVAAKCAVYGVCGGCSLMHMDPAEQTRQKEQRVLRLLEMRKVGPPLRVLPPITGSPWGYRCRAYLSARFDRKYEVTRVGFYEKWGSHLVTKTSACEILHPDFGLSIPDLASAINKLSIRDRVPVIGITAGTLPSPAAVFRTISPPAEQDLDVLVRLGEEKRMQIYTQPSRPSSILLHYSPVHGRLQSPVAVGVIDNWMEYSLYYELPFASLKLHFLPFDFTQVNLDLNVRMVEQAISLLDLKETDEAVDLFCGIGNFTLPLAQRVRHVTGVDADPAVLKRLVGNAKVNGLAQKVSHLRRNLYAEQDPLSAAWFAHKFIRKVDKVILDPPRSGAEAVCGRLPSLRPSRIVYISCNPETLARDAAVLAQNDYILEAVGIVDQFPHTDHIETISLFVQRQ